MRMDQSFALLPMEPMERGPYQPLTALGAGINGVVGGVSGVCMQPTGELRYFHLDQFLVEQLFAQQPWFGISYRMSRSK